ncbi:MAG: DUF5615 family PIN-like protein, partial [Thiobacillaceae bacterium]|nr:DUF5615 family PIN-like protein [Thiobacillaceae bacterium]
PPALAERLQDLFPDASHVEHIGLGSADDERVWHAACAGDYAIVTKDADFQDLATLRGVPPKVIWIRRGNCTTAPRASFTTSSAGTPGTSSTVWQTPNAGG